MKSFLLISSLSFLAGCAGLATRPQADVAAAGNWSGYLVHDGVRAPVSVFLGEDGSRWLGTFNDGDGLVPISVVDVGNDGRIHLEVEGSFAFDGTVAGDKIEGTVTGPSSGSFALDRQTWQIMLAP